MPLGRAELRFHIFHAGDGAQAFYRARGFEAIDLQPDETGFVEFAARPKID